MISEAPTIHDKTEPVEDEGKRNGPFHSCGAACDSVASRGVCVTGTNAIENTKRDSCERSARVNLPPDRRTFGDGKRDDDQLVYRVSLQVVSIGVVFVQTPLQETGISRRLQRLPELRRTISADWKMALRATPTMKTMVMLQ